MARTYGRVSRLVLVAGLSLLSEGYGADADFTGNGIVDLDDFFLFGDHFGSRETRFDLDGDGVVGFDDFFILADQYGNHSPAVNIEWGGERIREGQSVLLLASGSDVEDGRVARFVWRSGRGAALGRGDSLSVKLSAGSNLITLVGVDSHGGEGYDTLTVQVEPNSKPKAIVSGSLEINRPVVTRVVMDASGSSDPDGDSLSFIWRQILGPPVQLTIFKKSTYQAEFTTNGDWVQYQFAVIVSDGAKQDVDFVLVSIRPLTERLPGGAAMQFVEIPSGSFFMGLAQSDVERLNEEHETNFYTFAPEHRVTITQPFYLSRYEVTQGIWERVMGSNPYRSSECEDCCFHVKYIGPNYPIVCVSWEDVQEFISMLNAAAGDSLYRLPTEAEWEYAAKAGTGRRWSFGGTRETSESYAWTHENTVDSDGVTAGFREVGRKLPNPWGLHDMFGNVQEFCQDWFIPYPGEPETDPRGPNEGLTISVSISGNRVLWRFWESGGGGGLFSWPPSRVTRGGDFVSRAMLDVGSPERSFWPPSWRDTRRGFRLARELRN